MSVRGTRPAANGRAPGYDNVQRQVPSARLRAPRFSQVSAHERFYFHEPIYERFSPVLHTEASFDPALHGDIYHARIRTRN